MEQDQGVEDRAVAMTVVQHGARPVRDREPGRPCVVVAAQAVDHGDRRGGGAEHERPLPTAVFPRVEERRAVREHLVALACERLRDQEPGRGVVTGLGQQRMLGELPAPPAGLAELPHAEGVPGGHREDVHQLVRTGRGARYRSQDVDATPGGSCGAEGVSGQAWREANELRERELMRDGRWLVSRSADI
ncbi:hypothetical protein ACIQB5_33880 [Streptomyces sp. NPDC088560]|uniref:hypothetical protein n=1 Tax=Streptomyces sp. NPDC088560 TaxID=3365868 RepID=UPI0038220D78